MYHKPLRIICALAMVLGPRVLTSPTPRLSVSGATEGTGTWYGEDCGDEACYQSGACSFVDYVLPSTIDGSTCVSEAIWNSSYHCGGCVSITYEGKKKTAMITNKTGGNAAHLDMTPDMFAQLASKSLGEIPIQWEFVQCPITTPLQIRVHKGASQYWFAATVENAVYRTASMEISGDGGQTWNTTTRNTNNYFEFADAGGTGTETVFVRLTSETGSRVVVEDVVMTSEKVTAGASNYA